MSAIYAEGLSYFFGRGALRKQILFDIDVEIPQGEIVIVTGPSGSGKTTLLTLIGALRSSKQGVLRVLGEDLVNANNKTLGRLRQNIGFIFQQHNLLAAISSVENVELGLRVSNKYHRSELRARAIQMLESVGLGDRMFHKPDQLSGGQRQRVAIARALAAEPAMILADEPTASLDKESGRDVVDRMKALAQEQGATILIVTHDNRILDVADRIVHLEDGRLSTFTDSVISNNKHMMGLLAGSYEKIDLREAVDTLDDGGFNDLVAQISTQTEQFIEATAIANDHVFHSMLEQSLFVITRKLAKIVNADRASLFLVDEAEDELVLRVTDELPVHEDIRIPLSSGVAGAAVTEGKTIIVADAYADSRFNQEVDREFGYKTNTILAIPIKNRDGKVFAVAQLLNRHDGKSFTTEDEELLKELILSLAVMLEGWQGGLLPNRQSSGL